MDRRTHTRQAVTFALMFLAQVGGGDAALAQPHPPRTVLAVFSSTEDYPANPVHDAGIREGLLSRSDVPTDYYTEYLESDRFPAEQAALALRDYIHGKYRARRIDVVIAVTDISLRFVLRYRQELFPDAPIVYFGNVEVDANVRREGAGATGVVVGGAFGETLALALKLHPATERTFVVAQTPNIALQDSVRSELRDIAQGRISYIAEASIPDLIAAVEAVPPRSLILYIRHSREDPGLVLFASEVARLVAAAAPVPVYGVSDSYIGSGVVGGAVYRTRAIGVRLGEMARQVLDGTRAQDLPIERGKSVPTFDWRQVQRWGISESRLPAGSTILYKQPGAWELYKPQLIGVGLLVLLQSALIATLLIQRTRRVRVERALRESEERFRLMADTAPVLVWRADTANLCDFVNQPWLDFTGRTMAQELDNGWLESVWPDDLDRCQRTCVSAFDARQPFRMEFRLRRADGMYRWVLDTGVPRYGPDGSFAGYIGSCLDITERKASEDALRESQQQYALATAAGAVGVWDWNLETNEIYVDPTLKSILGYDDAGATIRADDWGSRIHLEDVARVTARAQACIGGSIDDYEVEHRMIHKDGSARWFLSRGSLLKRAGGTPHRMVGTKVDITERKRVEDAIREQDAVLRASDREIQSLVGRLIAAQEVERSRIARDLHDDTSQQLAGLAIALSGLKRKLDALHGVDRLQEDVSSLQQRTIALAKTVRHLSHDLHPSVLEHAGLVAALTAYCTEVEGQHAVRVTFSSEGDFTSTDLEAALCLYRIAQEALRNVVAHAGALRADVRLLRTGGNAELTIADDGIGFDIVGTRDRGTGLGLVSISERVRLAGGTVSITTELNKGTRIRVQIPVSQGAQRDAGGAPDRFAASA